uniref:Uncharacterized protein n=1 Tax=Compsopogon caeruleus TaxID=31354 RepID=A0A6T6DA35_9RHOD|mmetsp:Transcript_8961/g.18035  ORF Transcript_8961/g.18035 Transcript_8961/m.18035 type:complete len:233 (+) Transcript_8961:658-1356(+)
MTLATNGEPAVGVSGPLSELSLRSSQSFGTARLPSLWLEISSGEILLESLLQRMSDNGSGSSVEEVKADVIERLVVLKRNLQSALVRRDELLRGLSSPQSKDGYLRQVIALRKKDLAETRMFVAKEEIELRKLRELFSEQKELSELVDDGIEARAMSMSSSFSSSLSVLSRSTEASAMAITRSSNAAEAHAKTKEKSIHDLSNELVSLSDEYLALMQEREDLQRRLSAVDNF